MLAAVKQNGRALQHAADMVQAERAIVLAAVASNGSALQWASTELRADVPMVLAAARQNVGALRWALGLPSDVFQGTIAVLLAVLFALL